MTGSDKISATRTEPAALSRLPIILSCLLVVQIGLALLLRANEVQYQSNEQNAGAIIQCDFKAIGKIVIEDNPQGAGKKKTSLSLEAHGSGWEMPDQFGFPAAKRSVTAFIENLGELKKGFPIATTADSRERFKVSPDNYEHSITLFVKGKPAGTLFVGAPSGPKTVSVRWSTSNDVYSVELPTDSLSTDPNNWYDTVAVQFARKDVTGVEFPNFSLRSAGTSWILSYKGKDQPIGLDSKDGVINRLINITFQSVLGRKDLPAYNSDKPGFWYTVTLMNNKDKRITYSFSKINNNPNWVLKKSDFPFYLSVDNWFVDNVKMISPEAIIQEEAILQERNKEKALQRALRKQQRNNQLNQ